MLLPKKLVLSVNRQSFSRMLHSSKPLGEAVVIDGRRIAKEIQAELKVSVDSWVNSGKRRPKLVAILVGENEASKTYVRNKVKVADLIGIESETLTYNNGITEEKLISKIQSLNRDPLVDGILLQLPLPEVFDEKLLCSTLDPTKDVDGFHVDNIGKLCLDSEGIIPATAWAVKELIQRSRIETFGRNAVVVGRSKHVGLPIALLLHADGTGKTGALDMTTTICHRYTPPSELQRFTKLADVIIMAAGVPGLLTREMVKPGACVVDVGITRIKTAEGRYQLKGDVDFDGVKDIAGYITPVPNGVGPMTVTMLMKNTFLAAKKAQSQGS